MKKAIMLLITFYCLIIVGTSFAESCGSECSRYKSGSANYERCIDSCEQGKASEARNTFEKTKESTKKTFKKIWTATKRKVNNWTTGWGKKK